MSSIRNKDYTNGNIIGLDSEKRSVKVLWTGLSKNDDLEMEAHKYSGIRKSIWIALVCGVDETYHNLKLFFEIIELSIISYQLSQDLKLTNLVTGITNFTSKYPCPSSYCLKTKKGAWIVGTERTAEQNTRFLKNGRRIPNVTRTS